MKGDILNIIKILAINYTEIMIDIDLESFTINSIEVVGDNIILHTFSETMDIEFSFEDLEEIDKEKIYLNLSSLLYN